MWVWGVASFINHRTTECHFVYWLDFKLETHKTVFADQTDASQLLWHQGSGQVTLL